MEFSNQAKTDKFTFLYTILLGMALFPIVLQTLLHCNGLLTFFFATLSTIILIIYFTIKVVIFISRKQWLKVLSVIASPIIAIVVLWPIFYIGTHFNIPVWTHFHLHKSYYLAEVAKIPKEDGKPRIKTFHIGSYYDGTTDVSDDLFYDESDAMKKDNCSTVISLGNHFYFISDAWDCRKKNSCSHPSKIKSFGNGMVKNITLLNVSAFIISCNPWGVFIPTIV